MHKVKTYNMNVFASEKYCDDALYTFKTCIKNRYSYFINILKEKVYNLFPSSITYFHGYVFQVENIIVINNNILLTFKNYNYEEETHDGSSASRCLVSGSLR